METITMIQMYTKVYAVGWGSSNRPFVIERMMEGSRVEPYSVDVVKAVYDGEVLRVRLAKPYSRAWKLTPILGYFADKASAEAYAAEVAEMVEHKSKLHYPSDVVEKFRYVGRKNYCEARKGLWLRHFPTWNELRALTALRDAAAAMPLQLEFKAPTVAFQSSARPVAPTREEAVAMGCGYEWDEEYRACWNY